MNFCTPLFAVYLAIFLVFTLISRGTIQIVGFTILSYLFYAASGPPFVILLFVSSVVDFLAGNAIHKADKESNRRLWLIISMATNLGLLGVFKYGEFFLVQFNELSSFLHIPVSFSINPSSLPLPPGISFYTFQTMSYTIDIYRKKLSPCRSVSDFFCYVAFFPQLVAGPIVRAKEFLPQLKSYRPLQIRNTMIGMEFILVGLIKKMVIADNLAYYVEKAFRGPGYHLCPADLLLASVLFAIQIYCDFSGYTDVARGIGKILGFTFPTNFSWPYLSHTIRDFWRRWHMTLSYWLRDYIYIPLGGSRVSPQRRRLNLLITWSLTGFWHGAAWKFLLWGLYHGVLVELTRYIRLPRNKLMKSFGIMFTFFLTCLGWMIFRAENAVFGAAMVAKSLGFFDIVNILFPRRIHMNVAHLGPAGFFSGFPYCGWQVVVFVLAIAVGHILTFRFRYALEEQHLLNRLPVAVHVAVSAVVLFFVVFLMGPQESFIYFAF